MANGLTPKEEMNLKTRLQQMDEILTRRCLMGHGEAEAIADVARRIRIRLNPWEADKLEGEAARQIELHANSKFVIEALQRVAACA